MGIERPSTSGGRKTLQSYLIPLPTWGYPRAVNPLHCDAPQSLVLYSAWSPLEKTCETQGPCGDQA